MILELKGLTQETLILIIIIIIIIITRSQSLYFFFFFFFGCVGSSLQCAGCSLWYVRVSSGILIVVCQLSCLTHVGSWFHDQGSNLHPCTGRWVLSYWTTREGPPLVSLRHPGKREWMLKYCNTGAKKPYNFLQGLLDSRTYLASRNSYKRSLGN